MARVRGCPRQPGHPPDVEELLTERGVELDHVSVYRWVQRFTPMFPEAARPSRHGVGDHGQVDETYVRVAGSWRYLHRAVDQVVQVVEVFLSAEREPGRPDGSAPRPPSPSTTPYARTTSGSMNPTTSSESNGLASIDPIEDPVRLREVLAYRVTRGPGFAKGNKRHADVDGKVVRVHPIRHNRTKEHGVYAFASSAE